MKSSSPSSRSRGGHSVPATSRNVVVMFGVFLGGMLGGCSSNGSADLKSMTSVIRLALAPPQRVTVKQAAAIPYATIGVRLGSSPQAIATLATDDGGQRLWASGQKVMIATTRAGQIQRTVGLPFNLTWMVPTGPAGVQPSAKLTIWSADFVDLGIYAATIQCDEVAAANVQISILGNRIATRRTNLRCTAPQLNWSFQNAYWTDPQTGTVWRSIQHVHPKLDPIEIETLRPPG
jgi:hypothetical protein